jgi:hypothetical protein
MKTAIAPNIRPDSYESEERPAPVPDLTGRARSVIDTRSFDPTQGRKIGAPGIDVGGWAR